MNNVVCQIEIVFISVTASNCFMLKRKILIFKRGTRTATSPFKIEKISKNLDSELILTPSRWEPLTRAYRSILSFSPGRTYDNCKIVFRHLWSQLQKCYLADCSTSGRSECNRWKWQRRVISAGKNGIVSDQSQ